MSKTANNILWTGFVLLAFGLLAIWREEVVALIGGVDATRVPPDKLAHELASVDVREGHAPMDATAVIDRATQITVTRHYFAPEKPQAVVGWYVESLPPRGWKLDKQSATPGRGEVWARFCKGRVSLTVDALPLETGARYSLGAAWAKAPAALAYCNSTP